MTVHITMRDVAQSVPDILSLTIFLAGEVVECGAEDRAGPFKP